MPMTHVHHPNIHLPLRNSLVLPPPLPDTHSPKQPAPLFITRPVRLEPCLAPLGLLLEQHLLDLAHLPPDVHGHDDGHAEGDAKDDVLGRAVGLVLNEQHAEVDEEDLFGESEQRREGEAEEVDVAGREDGRGEVGGDGGESDEEDDLRGGSGVLAVKKGGDVGWWCEAYPETAIARQAGERAVVEVCPLELLGFAAEEELEGEPGAHCRMSASLCVMDEERPLAVRHTLSQECSCCHNPEPDPQPVYHATEEGYYFMAEQRRKRDDDQDGNWYQPPRREVANLLRPRPQVLSCPLSAAVGFHRWLPRRCWLECAHLDDLVMFDGDNDSQNERDDCNDPADCLRASQFRVRRGRRGGFLVPRLTARQCAVCIPKYFGARNSLFQLTGW